MYTVLFAAVLPAVALVFYIYLRDSHQREPLSQILKAVLYGVGSVAIALVLELAIAAIGLTPEPQSIIGGFWKAFIGAAFPEEIAKLLMLWLFLRNNKYFDERFDGIVYACCIGMGFAGAENIEYLFGNINSWESVAVSRAIFAVPGHFMFGVAMGYFYSQIYFRDMKWASRSLILLAPVLLHGVYDGLLFSVRAVPESVGAVLVVAFYGFCFLMYRISRKRIRAQHEASRPDNLRF